jgi:hypothetical protein
MSMTDDASTPKPLTADASADGAASAPPNDETKPPNNEQEPPAKESHLGQWIAVVAAVIAAAAAITSAAVNAHTSASTAHSQSHASAVLAERQEKREAYANYYNSLDDLDGVEYQAKNMISNYKPEDLAAFNAKIGEFNDKFIGWVHLDGVIQLLDSPDVDITRSKLIDAHNAIHDILYTFADAANENRFNTMVPQIADLNNKQNEASNLNTEFGYAAKKDLDNLGYGEH